MSNSGRLEQLLNMLRQNPDPFLLFAVAKEYEKSGEVQTATEYYERLIEEFPAYVGTYYHFGKLLEKKEDFESAIDIYNRGLLVSKAAGDNHAASELAEAKMSLED
jgi:tetratricopeptide (TPR) repeat protein